MVELRISHVMTLNVNNFSDKIINNHKLNFTLNDFNSGTILNHGVRRQTERRFFYCWMSLLIFLLEHHLNTRIYNTLKI